VPSVAAHRREDCPGRTLVTNGAQAEVIAADAGRVQLAASRAGRSRRSSGSGPSVTPPSRRSCVDRAVLEPCPVSLRPAPQQQGPPPRRADVFSATASKSPAPGYPGGRPGSDGSLPQSFGALSLAPSDIVSVRVTLTLSAYWWKGTAPVTARRRCGSRPPSLAAVPVCGRCKRRACAVTASKSILAACAAPAYRLSPYSVPPGGGGAAAAATGCPGRGSPSRASRADPGYEASGASVHRSGHPFIVA